MSKQNYIVDVDDVLFDFVGQMLSIKSKKENIPSVLEYVSRQVPESISYRDTYNIFSQEDLDKYFINNSEFYDDIKMNLSFINAINDKLNKFNNDDKIRIVSSVLGETSPSTNSKYAKLRELLSPKVEIHFVNNHKDKLNFIEPFIPNIIVDDRLETFEELLFTSSQSGTTIYTNESKFNLNVLERAFNRFNKDGEEKKFLEKYYSNRRRYDNFNDVHNINPKNVADRNTRVKLGTRPLIYHSDSANQIFWG